MKLTLEIELDDNLATDIARSLGMKMTKEGPVGEVGDAPVIEEVAVTSDEIDIWLEEHMKNTIGSIYSKTIEGIKLASLDALREREVNNIKDSVSKHISVGVKK